MTTMLEKMAADMASAFAREGGDFASDLDWTAVARAGLQAIREPSDSMIEASWTATRDVRAEDRMMCALSTGRDAHGVKTAHRHRAMIDFILNEKPEGP